jgi:hypothetical protein
MKVSELTGAALDWAVAECEEFVEMRKGLNHQRLGRRWAIIERERRLVGTYVMRRLSMGTIGMPRG